MQESTALHPYLMVRRSVIRRLTLEDQLRGS